MLEGVVRKLTHSLLYRSIVACVLFSLVLIGWYYWCFEPTACRIKQTEASLAMLLKQRDAFYVLQDDVARLSVDCDDLSKKITEALSKKQQADLDLLFKTVMIDLEKSNLLVVSCVPQAQKITPWYKKQPIKLKATGDFSHILNFLQQSKKHDFFSKIPQAVIQRKDNTLMLECIIQSYKVE